MTKRLITFSLMAALSGLLFSCGGGPATPAEQMADADAAQQARDFDQALELYDGLIDWKGEGEVPAADRLKATMEAIKCMVALKRSEEAVERYTAIYEQFPGEMGATDSYKRMLAVLSSLNAAKADLTLITGLLEVANSKHAAKKDDFQKFVDKMVASRKDMDDAARAKLKDLGYL